MKIAVVHGLSYVSPRGGWVALGRSLFTYLVFPNLVFWVAGHFVYIDRPVVNIDYLLLGAIAGVLPRRLVVLCYTVLLLDDALVTLTPLFHFDLETGLTSMSFGLRLGRLAIPFGVASIVSASIVASLGVWLSETEARRHWRPGLFGFAVVVAAVDVLGGTSRFSWSDTARIPFNVATSAGFKTITALYHRSFASGRGSPSGGLSAVGSATDDLRAAILGGHGKIGARKVVLVLVESLGSFTDVKLDSKVLAPLLSPGVAKRYEIRFSTVPTRGATTSAELRELCGVGADYQRIDAVDVRNCLPAKLRALGFRTVAVHGYVGQYFDRVYWYPRLGFDEVWFAEQFAQIPGVGICGAVFRGVCDKDAARLVRREILGASVDEPLFIYWLTLNSHLPVNEGMAVDSSFDCSAFDETQRFEDVCALIRLQRVVISSVAALATDPKLSSTRFVVVGDHTPPFMSRARRSLFVEGRVPFVDLMPRVIHRASR